VGRAGDLDGDGFDDLLVSWRSHADNFSGGVAMWYGGAERFSGSYALAAADVTLTGERIDGTGEQLGIEVVPTGSNLLIGAMYHPEPLAGPEAGCVYVVPFEALALPAVIPDTALVANGRLLGSAAGGRLGESVIGVDLDGDGAVDLIAAGEGLGPELGQGGAVFVSNVGALVGDLTVDDGDATWTGVAAADGLGVYGSFTSLPDSDGDGYEDVLAGAGGAGGGAGAVYLLRGRQVPNSGVLADQAAVTFTGAPGDGITHSSGGDFDGDGALDVALASGIADEEGLVDAGIAWVFYGPLSPGVHEVRSMADAQFTGEAAGDVLGDGALKGSLAVAGDLDGDGLPEVVLGADHADHGGADAGSVYVLFGALR
jgi:hypothetical protein